MSARILAGSASPNWACNSPMISAKLRRPSQRSNTCLPVPWSLIAPSGNRITRSSLPVLVSAPHRHPVARRGWLASSGGAMLISLNPERARRRPSGFNVSEKQCVELRPQDIALVAQRLDCQVLLRARFRVVVYVVHGELRIFRSLIKSGFEIIQASREPRIMLTQFFNAQGDQIGGK